MPPASNLNATCHADTVKPSSKRAREDEPEIQLAQKGKSAKVRWAEADSSTYHAVWLRANCMCPSCHDVSQQRLYLPHHVPDNLKLLTATVRGDNFEFTTDDGHTCVHPASRLKQFAYSESSIASRITHRRKFLTMPVACVPEMSYDELMEGKRGIWKWMNLLQRHGIVTFTGVPDEAHQVARIASQIAPVQPTIYGDTWNVVAKANPENIAYSPLGLVLHMDLLAYESAPGVQLLHCRRFDDGIIGGGSFFSDSFAAAYRLQEKTPHHFEVLTRVHATFHKHNEDQHMVYRRPHIVIDDRGELVAVNWSPPFEGPLQAREEDVEAYYQAYKAFAKEIEDESHLLRFRMYPNTCTTFLNRRILHARDEYKAVSGQQRVLEGCYILQDDFLNRFRKFSSEYAPDTIWAYY